MVITANQVRLFFHADNQMAIPVATIVQLVQEGIEHPDNLQDFDKDSLKDVANNLRNTGGMIPYPDPNAQANATISTPPFVFGAKSQKRTLEACALVRFYETIERPITSTNLLHRPIIRNFTLHWKALVDRKDGDVPEVPKVPKGQPIIKWTESFKDYLCRKLSIRLILLIYTVRENILPVDTLPPLATDMPHSAIHGSVEEYLISRALHYHPLFKDDNDDVYYNLVTALRGTTFLALIKPFQRPKDGRGALLGVQSQYSGRDKCQAALRTQEDIFHNQLWKVQVQFTQDHFDAVPQND